MKTNKSRYSTTWARQGLSVEARSGAANAARLFLCTLFVLSVTSGFLCTPAAKAAIITTGAVEPADPTTWTTVVYRYIGCYGDGSLTINGGSTLVSDQSTVPHWAEVILGYLSGRTGTITVDGAGSTWHNEGISAPIYAGYNGTGFTNLISTGIINVTNGGTLINNNDTFLGRGSGTLGILNVTGVGSTFTQTGVLLMGGNGTAWGAGTGIANITQGGKLNLVGEPNNTTGTVQIASAPGSVASMRVDGAGSQLTTADGVSVGSMGTGILTVTNGGIVRSGTNAGSYSYVGRMSGSGRAIVNGAGSAWNEGGTLQIGGAGSALNPNDGTVYSGTATGTVSISNGASMTANALYIYNSGSTLTVDVGKGSTVTVGSAGTGTLTNNGTIRLVAGAGAAAGTYKPVSAGTWENNGTIQVLGGVYNYANHRVTVSSAATAAGIGGASAAFNLATAQRALITDSTTGLSAGASFQAGTGNVTVNAVTLSPTALAALQALLTSDNAVLSAWSFSTTGTTVSDTNPVYLSLFAGPNQSLSTLAIWHCDGSTWSAFAANDLAYDGTYASFTVTGFSGYALSGTAPVPIPAAVWMLGSGLAGLVGMRRRLFKK